MRRTRKTGDKTGLEFKSRVNKNTTVTFYQRDPRIYCVIKKDLTDYEAHIFASAAPVTNEFMEVPEPFELTIGDLKILDKEIREVIDAINTVFNAGDKIKLDAVRLAIGNGPDDFVTIDESDLLQYEIIPTVKGLFEFVEIHRDGIIGLVDRYYIPEKGNLIFFDSKIRAPHKSINSIQITLMSSLQQRGLFMQQHHTYYGLQLYVIINMNKMEDKFFDFMNALGIEWEKLFLWREMALSEWIEVECERDILNLKSYLKSKYSALGFFDLNNITRVVLKNHLNFKIADKIAEILNRVKLIRSQSVVEGNRNRPLSKAEIAAAAKLSCAYYGYEGNLQFDKEVRPEDVSRYENELLKL